MHFYPRSPCGERLVAIHYTDGALNFYPRSPCGERQLLYIISTPKSNFYPRSPCGERLLQHSADCNYHNISIHALLAESDLIIMLYDPSSLIFLSTLSLRRATCLYRPICVQQHYFYPRSPCGERHQYGADLATIDIISIHALLAESDKLAPSRINATLYFYPRSPCGERRSTAEPRMVAA